MIIYWVGLEQGGVFEKYDRDSDMNGPSEELKDYAQQAIANYNEGKRKVYMFISFLSLLVFCDVGTTYND